MEIAESSLEKTVKKLSDEIFWSPYKERLKDAETFSMKWGPNESEIVNWRILKDSDILMKDDFPLDFPDMVHCHVALRDEDVSELDDPTNFFFKYVFPDITGKIYLLLCRHENHVYFLI